MLTGNLRSIMFVPSYVTKFLDNAVDLDADALIFDLEDSVPVLRKQEARENLKTYLDKGIYRQQVIVRVNEIDSGLLEEDIKYAGHKNTDAFVLSKVMDEKDIAAFEKILSKREKELGLKDGYFKIIPLIETTTAMIRAYEIARSSKRIVALSFGGEDYLRDLQGLHKEHGTSLLVPRSLIVMAARAAKVDVIDTPYLNVHDVIGFRKEADLSRELGFSGCFVLHPKQIKIANEAFYPSEEEIMESKRIIEVIEETEKMGKGVALLDGKLIGPPMEKRARSVLAKVKGSL